MFTGELVMPGEVEPGLWNEHISRYHFAALFAAGKTVLDVGCGAGYGTAVLAEQAAEAAGFDISPEAIRYARSRYSSPRFLIGSAEAFPAADRSVDVVTAFEVIEHLADWRALIEEANRVLKDEGVFLVSTPNKSYYSETRAEADPNPFQAQEFDLQDFEEALAAVFPFMLILAQNHQECIVFAGEQASSGLSVTASAPGFAEAHFFVAVCARAPVEIPSFTFVPEPANLLRERELDRALDELRTDLSLTRAEAAVVRADLAEARAEIERLTRERELAASSRWVRLGRKFNVGPDLTHAPS